MILGIMVKQLLKHYLTCYYNAVDEMCSSNGDMTSEKPVCEKW